MNNKTNNMIVNKKKKIAYKAKNAIVSISMTTERKEMPIETKRESKYSQMSYRKSVKFRNRRTKP